MLAHLPSNSPVWHPSPKPVPLYSCDNIGFCTLSSLSGLLKSYIRFLTVTIHGRAQYRNFVVSDCQENSVHRWLLYEFLGAVYVWAYSERYVQRYSG